jgi:hypothetical protein
MSGTMNRPGGLQARIQLALSGVKTVTGSGQTFKLRGAELSPTAIAAQLSSYLPTFEAPKAHMALYNEAVAARRALEPEVREFLVHLRLALVGHYKRGNPVLAKFGMGTGKPGVPSPETQVVATASRNLTRKKRGTAGKKQKGRITVVGKPVVTVGGAKTVVPPTTSATPPAVETALAAVPRKPKGK